MSPDPAKKFVLANLSMTEKGEVTKIGFKHQKQVADGAFRYIQYIGKISAAHPGAHDRKYGLCAFEVRQTMPLRLQIGDCGIDVQQGRDSFLK